MAFTKVTAAGINTGGSFVLENINTSGIITASAVNVGSAVTISSSGANVTGIVTAGTVQVGSATTIHTTGIDLGGGTLTSHNINSTGIITATSGFDGNLTGNVTGDLTGNVTGNVSSSGANTLGSLTVTNDATVGGALTVTGDFTVNGTTTTIDTIVTAVDSLAVDGDVTAGGNLDITGISTFNGTTEVQDSSFKVTNSNASGQYLQVTQNTNSSLNLDKVGDGAFYIRGNNIYLQNDGTSETYAGFEANGKTYLNYDGNTKLETTGTGVTITGDARVTGILTVGTASVTIDGSQDFPTIRPTLDLNFAATKTLDRRITFTRDSIGTYTDELGIVKYAPNNVPRFDHDPDTGESLGLLIEESRTNLITYSGEFDDTYWVKSNSAAIVANAVVSPDGNTTADELQHPGGSTYARIETTGGSSPSVTEGVSYSFTIYAKYKSSSDANYLGIQFQRASGVSYINLSTKTVDSGDGDVELLGNDWIRFRRTFAASSTGTSQVYIYPTNTTNITPSSIAANAGLYIWGAQLEVGSFATSYIPTNGSTVTRADDNAVISGTNFTNFYNASEGTIFAEYNTKATSSNTSKWAVSINDTTTNNYIAVSTFNTNKYAINIKTSGSTLLSIQGGGNVVSGEFFKSAGSYLVNDIDGAIDGTLLTENTSASIPTGLTRMEIGRGWSSGQQLEGHIKSIKYYNKKITNAQLQSLTRQ